MAAPLRIQRLEQQILAKVGEVIRKDLSDPRIGLVTITRVKLSRDLGTCQVFWSTLDEGARRAMTDKALESARGFIQREVAAELQLRSAPQIRLLFDKGFEGETRLQNLIGKARADDEARKKGASPSEGQAT